MQPKKGLKGCIFPHSCWPGPKAIFKALGMRAEPVIQVRMFSVKCDITNLHECDKNGREAVEKRWHSGFHLPERRLTSGPNPAHFSKSSHQSRRRCDTKTVNYWLLN